MVHIKVFGFVLLSYLVLSDASTIYMRGEVHLKLETGHAKPKHDVVVLIGRDTRGGKSPPGKITEHKATCKKETVCEYNLHLYKEFGNEEVRYQITAKVDSIQARWSPVQTMPKNHNFNKDIEFRLEGGKATIKLLKMGKNRGQKHNFT